MAVRHIEEAAGDRQAKDAVVSAAILLEHLAQTQAVMQATCIDLAELLRTLTDDPATLARLVTIRSALTAAGPAFQVHRPAPASVRPDLTYERVQEV